MIARIRKAIAEKDANDKGFTLIELLVVVIIIGILSAIAIPIFLNQKAKAYDASVKADEKNVATIMETVFTDTNAYPTTTALITAAGQSVLPSKGNTIDIYATASGASAGYVVVGMNANSTKTFIMSSYDGTSPVATVTVYATTTDAKAALTAGAYGALQPVYTAATPATYTNP